MTTTPGAPSPISTLPNLRDLGGYPAGAGSVRTGMLYRSTDFSSMASADLAEFEKLGVRTIYDLRSSVERTALPDPDLPDVTDVHLDVLADAGMAIPANIGKFLSDPKTVAMATAELKGGKAQELISGTYSELVNLPSALTGYRTFYRGLLGEHPEPSLFHCTTGKDRTGWAAASFLTLMGVSKGDVYHDYLLTNDRLVPALKPLFDQFAAEGGDPDILLPILGVDAVYLDTAFATVTKEYGDIEGYFAQGLGIDESQQNSLRERYSV
ncbi:tyrosine-protein phosphatase [Gordonia sp. VNK1]|uniref:tyrosine-protein phosphatase n=1 Tax=Gordonia oleivorans TaxID=3156618 RepID=UPI0032B5F626